MKVRGLHERLWEPFREQQGKPRKATSWNPGIEHFEKGLVLSRDQSKKRRMRKGEVIGG